MSKERARRREERERESAVRAAARAAQAERAERRAARRRALTGVLPRSAAGRQTGVLAERRRRQTGMTIAIVLALNVLAFAFLPDWSARAMVAVVSLLAAPVLHTMLFRR